MAHLLAQSQAEPTPEASLVSEVQQSILRAKAGQVRVTFSTCQRNRCFLQAQFSGAAQSCTGAIPLDTLRFLSELSSGLLQLWTIAVA